MRCNGNQLSAFTNVLNYRFHVLRRALRARSCWRLKLRALPAQAAAIHRLTYECRQSAPGPFSVILLCAHSRLFEVDFGPSEFGHYHTRYSGPIRQWISPVLLNRLQYRPASENKDVKHPGYTNDYKTRQTIPDVLRDEDHKQYRIE